MRLMDEPTDRTASLALAGLGFGLGRVGEEATALRPQPGCAKGIWAFGHSRVRDHPLISTAPHRTHRTPLKLERLDWTRQPNGAQG